MKTFEYSYHIIQSLPLRLVLVLIKVVGYCFKLVNSKILIKLNSYVMFQNVITEMDPQYTSKFDIAY